MTQVDTHFIHSYKTFQDLTYMLKGEVAVPSSLNGLSELFFL